MTMVHVSTIARAVIYPIIFVIIGGGLGFAAYPQVVGHKLWLISWAYQSIFHPAPYDPDAVTRIATMKLMAHWRHKPGFTLIDWRDFGEEAREFRIELTGPDGTPERKLIRVWVRWKNWAVNNGEDMFYGQQNSHDHGTMCECFEVEAVQ